MIFNVLYSFVYLFVVPETLLLTFISPYLSTIMPPAEIFFGRGSKECIDSELKFSAEQPCKENGPWALTQPQKIAYELEQRVNEVEKFYLNASIKQPNTSKNTSSGKHKDKEKHVPGFKKLQLEASRGEAAAAKRMQELMRQFGTILRQITQHKWAWPFMQPVDVEGLGLHDYYEIIDRPMDFSTIKNQMEARDGAGYKHVREIFADVRLVFKNAMKYNDEKSDVHRMAKTLLEKFEEKWLQLLPKVTEEEKRREEEEAEVQLNMQLAQEAAHAKMARDLCNELYEVDTHLEELREMVVTRCRKISIEEKRNLGLALTKLSPEDLSKALEIVAQNNPLFPASAEEVELDIDAQSELTLWRLKFFVKDALEVQGKSTSKGDNSNSVNLAATNPNISAASKRKKEICDALVKNAKKRNKKPSK
ncbi:PREDICTED: transcription factor GTE6-like isoform X1 [Nicotiana attenuata]|uniref:transcription factor GTE6-like isoform X1 n=1 Tax=Nicotiana attenuata TaxID=49451 RepID=UPI0009051726|nr:PREDICTED: transcription factor GTE6-like isoform X1 [Nicotiana attenuata]